MSIYAHSRIELSISADSRTFQLHWPLSTGCEIVLYTVDESLHYIVEMSCNRCYRFIDSATFTYAHQDLFTRCHNIAMSLYDIIVVFAP